MDDRQRQTLSDMRALFSKMEALALELEDQGILTALANVGDCLEDLGDLQEAEQQWCVKANAETD